MTSMVDDSVSSILCTSKQTRFDIAAPNYRELDIEGLNIVVTSAAKSDTKRKAKAKSEGTEILTNATLRLKAGQRYAVVGRNGTGKSTLLKAIAQKLIPGIPEETRITILQQTDIGDTSSDERGPDVSTAPLGRSDGPTVLEEVIERATSRGEVEREVQVLTRGIESTHSHGALRSYRKVRHDRLQRELFLKDKDARLRSGARGMQARKALTAMEKQVAEYLKEYEQTDEEILPEALAKETSEAADMLAELQLSIEPSKLAETETSARKILAGLGFSDVRTQQPVSSLSGGWRMRTALAACLLQKSDILILDEPTNFLDLLGIMWLQHFLSSLAESSSDAPTLVLVSHDRDFISLCTDLLIIKDKELTYFHGDLPMYESSKAEKKAHLTKMKEAQDKQKEHIQQTIQRNKKEGKAKDDQNKMRQAKSRQKKLDDRMGLEVSARGGRFKLNRDLVGYHLSARAAIDVEQDDKPVSFGIPDPAELRFPGSLLSLENVSFRYAPSAKKSPLVLDGVGLTVSMGDRIGILGLNGSGKSTLVRLLAEEALPVSGTLIAHPRLRRGYYSQHAVEQLQVRGRAEPELTALSLLAAESKAEGSTTEEGEIRRLLARLGLAGRVASDVPVARLSGGQLVRLELARVLRAAPHLLVLDEVTTHLDYETVAAVREALRGWPGAVVLVSHDRWFVRGVIEGLVHDEGEGDGSDSDGSGDENGGTRDAAPRRREVLRLRNGKLARLAGGVQAFEDFVEKRVRKLANA